MKLKSVRDLDVKGKIILLRSDLNSDIVKGKILKGERIKESLKTIALLKKRKARVVILAHQGNPGKGDFLNLKQHAKLMRLKFVDDVVGERAVHVIRKLKDGDVVLLDNVRKVGDEFKPRKHGNVILKTFLPLVDVYVNDAFSVSHRNHTSIVGFAGCMESGVGLLFEKEILALEKVKMKGAVFILAGSKPESNVKLLGKNNKVLAGGLFGQVCLAAKGFDFGFQNDFLKKSVLVDGGYEKFLGGLKRKLDKVETPVDFAVNFEGKRREFGLDEFPMNLRIDDIGAGTIAKFGKIIRNARAVYMKGPVGFAEDKKFRKGTVGILKAISECKGFSLIGGGQLSEAVVKSRIGREKFGHVSLSGGALLRCVAGERLVGLEVLGYY